MPWGAPSNSTLGSFSAYNFNGVGGAAGNYSIAAGAYLNFNQTAGGTVIEWDDLGLDPNLSGGWGLLQSGNGLAVKTKVRISCVLQLASYDTANPPQIGCGANGFVWWQNAYVQKDTYNGAVISPILEIGSNYTTDDIDQWLDMNSVQFINPAAAAAPAVVSYARLDCNIVAFP